MLDSGNVCLKLLLEGKRVGWLTMEDNAEVVVTDLLFVIQCCSLCWIAPVRQDFPLLIVSINQADELLL